MRRIFGLACLIAVAGCSDPENSKLKQGDVAIVADELGTTLLHANIEASLPQLKPGVRLRIESDPGFFQETADDIARLKSYRDQESRQRVKAGPQRYEEGHATAKFRKLKVVVLDGEYAKATGEVFRYAVVPSR